MSPNCYIDFDRHCPHRQDVIVRHECLKGFTMATILQSDHFDLKYKTFVQWIKVAQELASTYGDYFGFGAIMSALDALSGQPMWNTLNSRDYLLSRSFKEELKPLFTRLNEPSSSIYQIESNTSIPYLVQACRLIECNDELNSKLLAHCTTRKEIQVKQ